MIHLGGDEGDESDGEAEDGVFAGDEKGAGGGATKKKVRRGKRGKKKKGPVQGGGKGERRETDCYYHLLGADEFATTTKLCSPRW